MSPHLEEPEPVETISIDDGKTVFDVKKLNGGSALLNGELAKTKHWARIFHTQPSEEIAEDMDKSFNNLGLVLALLLTMAMPDGIEADDVDSDSVWGSNANFAIQLYGLMIGCTMSLCLLGLFVAIELIQKMSDIPSRACTIFLVKMGPGKTQAAAIIWAGAAAFFLVAMGLRVSLFFSQWVTVTWASLTVVAFCWAMDLITHAKHCSIETLHVMKNPSAYLKVD